MTLLSLLSSQCFQSSCPLLYKLVSTKFYFDKPEFAVTKMNDRVAFEAVFVSEMINLSV